MLHRDYEITLATTVKVRVMNLPAEFDDKVIRRNTLPPI